MCTQSKIFYEPEIFMSLEFKILGKNVWKHSDLLGLTQVPQQPCLQGQDGPGRFSYEAPTSGHSLMRKRLWSIPAILGAPGHFDSLDGGVFFSANTQSSDLPTTGRLTIQFRSDSSSQS